MADASRRRILRFGLLGAGGVVVAASGGTLYRAMRQDVFSPFAGAAFEPWRDWEGTQAEGAAALLNAAVLAASPHNSQPWLFGLREGGIDVFADRQRHLGSADPYRREMHVGLGCAIENIIQSARAHGYAATVAHDGGRLEANPGGTPVRVARIDLQPSAPGRSALYEAIALRHTDRGAYDPSSALPAKLRERFSGMATQLGLRLDFQEGGEARTEFDRQVLDATDAFVATNELIEDSQKWFRNSPREVDEHRDGLTMDGVGMSAIMTATAKILPPMDARTAHAYWAAQTRDVHLATARMTGIISVRDRYDAAQNVMAGRLCQFMQLMATAEEVAMQPINQVIELADRQHLLGQEPVFSRRLADLIGTTEWQPTYAFRLGRPTRKATPSPRRSAHDRIV